MYQSRIAGMGFYVPDRVVTNDDLAKMFNTSDEWIQKRTGIKERHYAAQNQGVADMSLVASLRCLEDAKVDANDIDLIVLASLSPDYCFPGSGCFLQDYLGIKPTPAMDVRTQCTGFLYSLATADQFIKTGMYKTVLVVGAENHSSGIEFADRGRAVTVLFGDGAGAVLLQRAEDKKDHLVLGHVLYAEGKHAKKLWCEYPASKITPRLTKEGLDEGRQYPILEGKTVFRHAVQRMPEVIIEILSKNGYTVEDMDLLIPHQANLRINEFAALKLKLPAEKMFNNIQRYGNTTAATLPICMVEARDAGLIKPGALICLAAFGSGFTWGASLIRW